MKKTSAQWPDALLLVAGALQSGLNLRDSLVVLIQDGPEPLRQDLQEKVGSSWENLSAKDIIHHLFYEPSLTLAKAGLLISLEAGGEAASILKVCASLLRKRMEMEGRVRVASAQARLTAWVVGLSPFSFLLLMIVMSPEVLRVFFSTPLGWMLLALILGLTGLGLLIIHRMARLDA